MTREMVAWFILGFLVSFTFNTWLWYRRSKNYREQLQRETDLNNPQRHYDET